MKNRVSLIIITVLYLLVSNILVIGYSNNLKRKYNSLINNIVYNVRKEYPGFDDERLYDLLNNESNEYVLGKYNINKDDYVLISDISDYKVFLIISNGVSLGFIVILVLISYFNKKKNDNNIIEIINLVENINKKNYEINIDNNSDDKLSILKNEIYKIGINLKEERDNSIKDKISIKKSMEDISHQLKTPLTSINIMLDNILDNPNMEESVRNEFLSDIKRDINNVNSLILNLLKLSEFDVNAVKLNNKSNSVSLMINKVIDNVSMLADLKNIKINIDIKEDFNIYSDMFWQVEALTNIVKNSLEHSNEGNFIDIKCVDNKLYSLISIKDYGEGISKNDLKHIFERFFKTSNSKSDSNGIGLSLANSIIKENNGRIEVSSKLNEYTIFDVKYFK